MDSYGPETYGEQVADLSDDWYRDHPDTRVAVERLAELAGAGPVLELGVGTGRLALPLAERDLEAHGSVLLTAARHDPVGLRSGGPAGGASRARPSLAARHPAGIVRFNSKP
jgi:hypothetical protein